MSRPTRDPKAAIRERKSASGLGVGCAEAQADGVPCEEIARDCEECERAGKALAAVRPGKGARPGEARAPAGV